MGPVAAAFRKLAGDEERVGPRDDRSLGVVQGLRAVYRAFLSDAIDLITRMHFAALDVLGAVAEALSDPDVETVLGHLDNSTARNWQRKRPALVIRLTRTRGGIVAIAMAARRCSA